MHRLNRESKKVREDKKEALLEQLRQNKEDPHEKHHWKAVSNLQEKITPKFIQMRNRSGMLVPLRKRAEAISDYLEEQHWQKNPAEGES